MGELVFGIVFLIVGIIGLSVSIKDGVFQKIPWGVDLRWLMIEICLIIAGIVILFRFSFS